MLKEDGAVQRNDLNLRIEIIGLNTEIYKIKAFEYLIYCTNYKGAFDELIVRFNASIRQLGLNIVLSDKRPLEFLNKIDNIPLSNAVNGFKGMWMTELMLNNFIKSKFYDIDITSITIPTRGINFAIEIEVSKDTDVCQIQEIKEFLVEGDLGTDNITITYAEDYKKNEYTNKSKHDQKFQEHVEQQEVMNLGIYKEYPFMLVEADTWFSHADKIYSGKMKRKDLPFFQENSLKCFLDCTTFDNINLRNVLLLYDTVYLAPPINEYFTQFMDKQGMTPEELITLVDMGKVVLLLPNLEKRYNKNMLLEVYKKNPNAIVGRRGINTLLASYLVETKDQYEKRIPKISEITAELYMRGVKDKNCDLQNIARLLAWPITATAKSFEYLTHNSPMTVSNFGINDVVYNNIIKNDIEEKILFEFTMNSLSTHLATALQATYFPFVQNDSSGTYSDAGVSNILGDFLKIFWYNADNLDNLKILRNQNKEDYLNLFECKENISILKVATLADDFKTQEGFRDILCNLDNMNEKKRKCKVREYNDLLFEVHKEQGNNKKSLLKFMLGSAGFLPLNLTTSFILSTIGVVNDCMDSTALVRKKTEMKTIEKCMNEYGINPEKQSAENIYLLDKISSVAMLK